MCTEEEKRQARYEAWKKAREEESREAERRAKARAAIIAERQKS